MAGVKTFVVLGQDVNGVGEYFETKRSCDQRSSWGQIVCFFITRELKVSLRWELHWVIP